LKRRELDEEIKRPRKRFLEDKILLSPYLAVCQPRRSNTAMILPYTFEEKKQIPSSFLRDL
jgi:hypothetical protein